MGKIGSYQYPDLKLSEAIEIVSKIINNFKGEITLDGLAEMLRMKKTGGGFITKVSSLRQYGLVSGGQKLIATDLAKRIILSPSQTEKENSKKEAYFKIQLLKDLHERCDRNTSKMDFDIILKELTKADLLEIKNKSSAIYKLFIEALSYDKIEGGKIGFSPIGTSLDYIDAKVGEIYIKVPRSKEQIDMARKVLDMLENQIKKETKKK